MNTRILLFNFVFYFVTLVFYYQGKQDPSSSLGYGFFIIIFWALSLVTLIVLLATKVIRPKTIPDKIGIVTATPVLCIVAIGILGSVNDTAISEWYFDKDHHRYKVNTYNYRGTSNPKRIEYYRSSNSVNPEAHLENIEKWIKDSTWVYFNKSGDTAKVEKYRNGELLK